MKNNISGNGKAMIQFALIIILVALCAMPLFGKNIFTRTLAYKPYYGGQSKMGIEFLDKMKALGYNGWLFDSPMIVKPEKVKPGEVQDLAKVVAHAKSLDITLIPMSQQMNELSYANINLAEALPTKNSRFVISDGEGTFLPDPVGFQNPGFESGMTGWKTSSRRFAIDKEVKRSGTSSLRVIDPLEKHVRASQSIDVKSQTTYEVSIQIKTSNIEYTGNGIRLYHARSIGLSVEGGGHYLHHVREPRGVQVNQDWKMHKIAFNSMGNSQVSINIVASEHAFTGGTIWYDDLSIREVALYETVVRSTTRPVVKSLSGKVFKEGPDYTVTVDPNVKKYNEGRLMVPQGSSIKQGDTVLVDWYKLANGVTATPSASMASPEAWDLLHAHVETVDEWLQDPIARFMKYSEWQICGWDPMTQAQFDSSGDYRAWAIRETENAFRKANHNREVSIYNDNVDPYHNGAGNGHNPMIWKSSGGAWAGLTGETVIVNWCVHNKDKSLRFFAGMEPEYPNKRSLQRQILSCAPFRPDDGNGVWKQWLPVLESLENDPVNPLPDTAVIGISYTAYYYNYTEMDVMKDACVKAGRWHPEWPFVPRDVSIKKQRQVRPLLALGLQVRNATQQNFRLQYDIQYNAHVNLKVMNSMGQTIKTLVHNKRKPAGKHTVDLDRSKIPAGVYFVHLSVDKGASKMTKKVVLF